MILACGEAGPCALESRRKYDAKRTRASSLSGYWTRAAAAVPADLKRRATEEQEDNIVDRWVSE